MLPTRVLTSVGLLDYSCLLRNGEGSWFDFFVSIYIPNRVCRIGKVGARVCGARALLTQELWRFAETLR